MKNLSYLYIAFALSVTTSACSDNYFLSESDVAPTQSNVICFNSTPAVKWSDNHTSRATTQFSTIAFSPDHTDSLFITTVESPQSRGDISTSFTTFGVTASIHANESTDRAYFFFNEKNIGSANSWSFDSNATYYWPGSNYALDFYAYAPYEAENLTVTDNAGQAPTLSYTVPTDIANHTDILVADAIKSISGDNKSPISLKFSHICTAVQFVAKAIPTGKILAIRLKGIKDSGTYRLDDSAWSLGSSSSDFAIDLSNYTTANGDLITPSDNCFIMIPQTLGSDAAIEIDYFESGTGKTRTLTASLSGQSWSQGKIVKYSVSVTADYQIKLDDLPSQVDAHYVMPTVKVNASYLNGKNWTLTADNNATLIFADQANVFINSGFWTDRYFDENGNDAGSARGASSLSGSIDDSGKAIYVMIPENTSSEPRNITLTLSVDGTNLSQAAISQLAAADGWEQIDESDSAQFGFNWSRTVCYTYVYTGYYFKNSYCQSVINDNGAADFAEVKSFYYFPLYRYYIFIDYSKLNSISANSSSDGQQNTISLNAKAGTSATNSFELTIQSIKKTESGHTNENAFRIGNGSSGEAPAPTGSNINSSAAIGECLKKNRYNLKKSLSDDKNEGASGYIPFISESDIVWYLPAVDQFASTPSNAVNKINPDECWSSTVGNGSTAYNGAKALISRTASLHIRAMRVR